MQLSALSIAVTKVSGGVASPGTLFTNGEQGAWYDPSDLTTLFQDAAGTTPVTAVEQPVGLMLDKSKGLVLGSPLNIATVELTPLSGSAIDNGDGTYTVSGGGYVRFKYNLADLKQGAYYKIEAEVLSASDSYSLQWCDLGPAQTGTGIRSVIAGRNYDSIYRFVDFDGRGPGAATFKLLSVRELLGNHAFQTTSAARPVLSARYNLYLATETLATQNVTTLAEAYTLTFTGTGTITLSGTSTGVYSAGTHTITCTAGTLTSTVAGTVTKADIRGANEGVGLPPYQSVNTPTDYDTVGFPLYIKPNGSSQFMVTNSIDFTATDKMTVVAGIRKLSDAAVAMLTELSSTYSNDGTFAVSAPPNNGLARYAFYTRGTGSTAMRASGPYVHSAPRTDVLSVSLDNAQGAVAANAIKPRVNGISMSAHSESFVSTTPANFGNYPLYLFARNGAAFWFSGRFYGAVIRGAQSNEAQIQAVERYMNQKTRAY